MLLEALGSACRAFDLELQFIPLIAYLLSHMGNLSSDSACINISEASNIHELHTLSMVLAPAIVVCQEGPTHHMQDVF